MKTRPSSGRVSVCGGSQTINGRAGGEEAEDAASRGDDGRGCGPGLGGAGRKERLPLDRRTWAALASSTRRTSQEAGLSASDNRSCCSYT